MYTCAIALKSNSKRFSQGELVVVRLTPECAAGGMASCCTSQRFEAPNFYYGRVISQRSSEGEVRVTLCETELRDFFTIQPDNVYKFVDRRDGLDSVKSITANLISEPHFYERVKEVVQMSLNRHLVSTYNLNEDLLKRVYTDKVFALSECAQITRHFLVLSKLDTSTVDLQRLSHEVSDEVQAIAVRFNTKRIFCLAREKVKRTIHNRTQSILHFLLISFKRLVNYLDSALRGLASSLKDNLNGKKKNELAEWWLDLVEKRVNAFAESKGFLSDAVPHDYISNPPNNIEAVAQNLAIIQKIMSPSSSLFPEVKAFITGLSAEIYTKIDAFQGDLQEAMNVTLRLFVRASAVDRIMNYAAVDAADELPTFMASMAQVLEEGALAHDDFVCNDDLTQWSEEQRISAHLVNVVGLDWGAACRLMRGCLKDLQYMCTMRALEETFQEDKPVRRELTHVVPISGLIMTRLHVIEQELNTALDVWRPAAADLPKSPREQRLKSTSILQKWKSGVDRIATAAPVTITTTTHNPLYNPGRAGPRRTDSPHSWSEEGRERDREKEKEKEKDKEEGEGEGEGEGGRQGSQQHHQACAWRAAVAAACILLPVQLPNRLCAYAHQQRSRLGGAPQRHAALTDEHWLTW
eukprot:CAMPEP_0177646890 /NCGR_PEP_ID=MMETSP0447-20121125/10008_1 /TAXON_ID=0 /ORGANISM="Stygamoeba regulata, Strain BSH-02190019" /LENGTH=636 /DNA_ID=CAMNT_0019149439 /DNA_START=11 /DNA_END=1922 /DNA_ORIENTATION=+